MKKEFRGNANKSGVYQIKNLINKKVYIGSAKNFKKRAYQHSRELMNGRHHNKHLQGAWNLDGSNNFLFEVLEVVEGDKLQRTTREKQHLEKWYENWEKCYNFQRNPLSSERSRYSKTPEETKRRKSEAMKRRMATPEGRKQVEEILAIGQKTGFRRGLKHSEETKKKMSEAKIGKKKSEETKRRMSEAQKGKQYWLGKHHTDETKKRISEASKGNTSFLGKHHSNETKEKLRQINLGKKIGDETRMRMSNSHKGKKHSEKTKKRIGDSKKGQVCSEETRKKIGLANSKPKSLEVKKRLRKQYNVWVYHPTLGKKLILDIYDFCEENNLSRGTLASVLSGERQHHKGWALTSNQ